MTRRNTRLVTSFAALAVLGSAGLLATSAAQADEKKNGASSPVAIGGQAPTFQLKDQNGKTVDLSDYKDKVVVLEWFNNECPFVVKHYQTGAMNQTAQKYSDKDVVWLAINTTNNHNSEHNKKIAGEWSIDRPILDDSEGKVGRMYGAKTTPHMFVINKGTIVYNGAIDSNRSSKSSDIASSENYVAKALDEVLAGQTVSNPETKPYGCSVKYK